MTERDYKELIAPPDPAIAIVRGLLEHPYPWDLMNLRRLARGYATEKDAAEDMTTYCTEAYLEGEQQKYLAAKRAAEAFLKTA